MKKRKRYLKGMLILLTILIGIPLAVYAKVQYDHSDTRIYGMEWKNVLPDALKKVYELRTPVSFRCDGSRIIVFEIENQTKELDAFIKTFSNAKEDRVVTVVEEALSVLEMETPYKIDLDQTYIWRFYSKNGGFDRLEILYFIETKRLYFIEVSI